MLLSIVACRCMRRLSIAPDATRVFGEVRLVVGGLAAEFTFPWGTSVLGIYF